VDLAGCPVGNDECDLLCALPWLERLNLSGTRVDGEGVEHLTALNHLEFLDLSGTPLGDAGLTHLAHIPALSTVVLDEPLVNSAGAETLRWANPKLQIIAAAVDTEEAPAIAPAHQPAR
jgi:hypothetical protein